jgi:HK97 family phage portal protein
MSLFARFERRDVAPLQTTNVGTIFNWSNEIVNETTALGVAAVFSAVSLLADSVASLPIRVYRTQNGLTSEQPLPAWLRNPSALSTPFELMHQIVSSMALHGNAYVLLDHNDRRDIVGVQALHPNNVSVWTANGRTRTYSVSGGNIDPADMLHIRWWTPAQAVKGLSPLEMQKTTIGLALAMERHLAQFYGEGATPSSVLETDTNLTAEQAQVLRETWTNTHNRHRRPAVLTQGLKWKPITVSAADMELNETRELQIAQVARVFRVPAYLIGARGDSQTYQNNEGAGMHFVTYTLLPWLRRIEEAISALLPAPQYVRFDTEAFLRADTLTRFKAHQLGIMSGFRTPNEARRVEDLEPYEGGDEFVMALPGAPMASPSNPMMPPVGQDEEPAT